MALWTLDEQQAIKPITQNNFDKFHTLQNEVEGNDLQLYLGFEFYQELFRNPQNYSVLLNGGTYSENGVNYTFKGLKYVCAYLLHARYVRESYLNDTFSGYVAHTGNDFVRVSASELANMENRDKDIAGTYWDECVRYLINTDTPYFPRKSSRIGKISSL